VHLSVIIVNYNVRHFLEQALHSVRRALRGMEGEVWVVDNNSVDDSVRMVREKFPEVHLLVNTANVGFAAANNQAIRQCQGRYVLLLNPDTLVEEDTFSKCLHFMDSHPEAGALGVKMIDGSGAFLPESKRGFPSPWVAFCKSVGLSALFPRSTRFNGYYLGHLSADETHEADILSGAFMWMRREALFAAGLLDETYFMYGEDIDLSYSIIKAGYKNYYFADTKIIHYKGESTKKGSLNYVKTFYQAMIIFTKKHFQGRQANGLTAMLQTAIWLRAGVTLAKNLWQHIWLPLLEGILIYAGLVFLKNFWADYYYHDSNWFEKRVLFFNFPLYTAVWLGSVWLGGGYDERYDLRRLLRSLGVGTLVLLAIYGLLDLNYRPSRALLLLGAVWAAFALPAVRSVAHYLTFRHWGIGREQRKNVLLAGTVKECTRVQQLLQQTGLPFHIIGSVSPARTSVESGQLGHLEQLDEMVRIYRISEVIFCSRDVRSQDILRWMTRIGPQVAYKIVPEESLSIIGSSNRNEPGELYTFTLQYNIATPRQQRNKRLFDLLWCAALPWVLLFSRHRTRWRQFAGRVLLGKATWVGYIPHPQNDTLPRLKPAAFTIGQTLPAAAELNSDAIARLNFLYAKDWTAGRDWEVLIGVFR
jgi:GT2 family glycosyltransferase